ncbi:DUF6461 domain-containing protein [Actinopolyspora mortivallis]|uniref:Uncharacterized protein n=1 Tax=Actinopolyspora mortivallis TaxID=33906 RepID=A0A2T0GS63_ACTMO|nr:DUF6461 domain-containing protein [Actinopolyspora mortivallis]PRW61937.1 hypothetical protein CEP50_17985 [Actinopolyspora mortivallis]
MAQVDMTEIFGEGWCVTLTRRSPTETLHMMGVEPRRQRPVTVEEVTARRDRIVDYEVPVTLLARSLGSVWSLVLELEGYSGWVGTAPEVLETLSSEGGLAGSAMYLPDEQEVLCARDGNVAVGVDPRTGRLWGGKAEAFRPMLNEAGLGRNGDGSWWPGLEELSMAQRAVLALETVLGIRLEQSMLEGPWRGGLSSR